LNEDKAAQIERR